MTLYVFARSLSFLRAFNPVVDRVSHTVNEGIKKIFNDRFIKLGLLAFDFQLYLFPDFLGYITHQAGKAVKNLANWNHADLHDPFLKVAGVTAEILGCAVKLVYRALNPRFKGVVHSIQIAEAIDYFSFNFLYGGSFLNTLKVHRQAIKELTKFFVVH